MSIIWVEPMEFRSDGESIITVPKGRKITSEKRDLIPLWFSHQNGIQVPKQYNVCCKPDIIKSCSKELRTCNTRLYYAVSNANTFPDVSKVHCILCVYHSYQLKNYCSCTPYWLRLHVKCKGRQEGFSSVHVPVNPY